MRNRLGLNLANIVAGDQPPPDFGDFGISVTDPAMIAMAQQAPRRSKFGSILERLGEIGDVMSATQGDEAAIRSIQQREQQGLDLRRQQEEEVRWTRRQQAEDQQWRAREDYRRDNPDPSPMVRDIAAWQALTPEQRQIFADMKKAQAADPVVTITLPNDQLYSGPRSGLADAIAGRTPGTPTAPVGKLRPVGGPASAPGTFP